MFVCFYFKKYLDIKIKYDSKEFYSVNLKINIKLFIIKTSC